MTQPVQPVPSETTERGRRSFAQRLVAALKLESSLYREVEHDRSALAQAAGVVGLAALATALGAAGVVGVGGMFGGILSAFTTWLVWTALVWVVGVKVFDHRSDFEELLRTLGFVAAPQLLYGLAILPLPLWHVLLGLTVLVMTLIAFVRALREALDVDTGQAVLVGALAVVAQMLLLGALGLATRLT